MWTVSIFRDIVLTHLHTSASLLLCRESSLSSLRGLARSVENSADVCTPLGPGGSLTSPLTSLGTPASAANQVHKK